MQFPTLPIVSEEKLTFWDKACFEINKGLSSSVEEEWVSKSTEFWRLVRQEEYGEDGVGDDDEEEEEEE